MPVESSFAALQARLTREVWIITAAHQGQRSGLTATWVSPAALDPTQPMLLAALSVTHFTTELIRGSRAFTAHLLRPDQTNVAWDFSRDGGQERDKFAGYDLQSVNNVSSPVLHDCLAWLDCRVVALHLAGERLFVWGDVVQMQTNATGAPLTDRTFFQSLTEEQRQHLADRRAADLELQRPLHEQWRLEALLAME